MSPRFKNCLLHDAKPVTETAVLASIQSVVHPSLGAATRIVALAVGCGVQLLPGRDEHVGRLPAKCAVTGYSAFVIDPKLSIDL